MPTKFGRVVSFGRTGRTFTEAWLSTGDRVELSEPAMQDLFSRTPNKQLVFVERRGFLFRYVQWLGTPEEALDALDNGVLRPAEVSSEVRWAGEAVRRIRDGTSTLVLGDPDTGTVTWDQRTVAAIRFLNDASPLQWVASASEHAKSSRDPREKTRLIDAIERAGATALAEGFLLEEDVTLAKQAAEMSADRASLFVEQVLARRHEMTTTDIARHLIATLRAAANLLVTLAMLRPYMTIDDVRPWAPYASLIDEVDASS